MSKTTELNIDHEVRIRIVEQAVERIESRFDRLETKMDGQFMMMIGLLFTSIIIPVVLKYLNVA